MGGGISVLLPEMAQKLNKISLDKFHELENECVLNNLSAVDTYLFLTTKYEELLAEEKQETKRLHRLSLQLQQEQQAAVEAEAAEIRSGSIKALKMKKMKKSKSKKLWGSIVEVKTVSAKTAKEDPRPSLFSLSTDSTDCDRQESTTTITESTRVADGVATMSNVASVPVFPTCAAALRCAPPELSFECALCKKVFDSRNMLDTHLAYSQMHTNNLKERDRKFAIAYKGAERLAGLAKESVKCFQDKLAMKKEQQDGFMTINQYRWKHALSKVIDRHLKSHYEAVLGGLGSAPFDSRDVKLLYSGTKFYWRVQATFALHIYLHVVSDTVEVVPQLLPAITAADNREGGGATVKTFLLRNKASKRIYLSHKLLKEGLFGLPKSLADAGTSERTVHADDAHVEPMFDPQAPVPDAEDSDDEEEETDLEPIINDSVDGALALYVFNRLNVDFAAVHARTKELHEALFFDCPSKADTPVLDTPPRNLGPAPVETRKMYQQWEVQQKMQQVAESQQSLAQAVNSAMACSNVVSRRTEDLLSPKRVQPLRDALNHLIAAEDDAPAMTFSPKNLSLSRAASGRRWTFVV